MTGNLVLVAGGSRGTGLLIVRLLLEWGYRVLVLTRNPTRADSRIDPAAELIAGDITEPDTLYDAVQGADQIIFTC